MDKNITPEEKKSLKHADIDKFGSEQLGKKKSDSTELLNREKKAKDKQVRGEDSSDPKKNRKIPLGVDIAIAVFIVVLAAALVVGVYFMIKSQTIGYENVTVKYTALVSQSDKEKIAKPEGFKGKAVYFDANGNSLYMGSVSEVKTIEDESGKSQLAVVITVSSKYKKDEGYSSSGKRIAVGCEYVLRVGDVSFSSEIVEISKGGR